MAELLRISYIHNLNDLLYLEKDRQIIENVNISRERDKRFVLKDDLLQEYDAIMIKLAICSAMEIEGEQLQEECKELSANPVYCPTQTGLKRVLKAYDKLDRWAWAKNLFPSSVPVFYKVTAVLCGLMIAVIITSASASADKPGFWNFVQSIQQEFALIGGKEVIEDNAIDINGWLPVNWEDGYIPTSIPDGFELVNAFNINAERTLEFSDIKNNRIMFLQNTSDESFFQNTEESTITTRETINGKQVFLTVKNEVITIIFEEENYIIKTIGIGVKLETLIKFTEEISKISN